ncbi:MAG: iron-sulfur cluster-binding protein [Silvibacterium sp.]|nr:iron-sulfur cluster-binding protein [Silvibacterium sp.]
MTLITVDPLKAPSFPKAAAELLRDTQLRRNVAHATDVIQHKRAALVAEKSDWQALRTAGAAIRAEALRHLDRYLEQFEKQFTAAGGHVHWASDADEARRIIAGILHDAQADEVIKIKSMTTAEIDLNRSLESAGVRVYETDLAELILQLGHDQPSHIIAPALHKNRHQVRDLFAREMHLPDLADDPPALTEAARLYLREKFLKVKAAICGANFLIAETGSICIVESEGNGRMCLTLSDTLISVAGIEKVIPTFAGLEVLLQTLPRAATGERMNPYNSIWTGVTPGDGPHNMHVVLLDNGRSNLLEKEITRQTLQCIRCGACLNTCPVYRQTGGHAYGSVYSGPIGAILTPQLFALEHAQSLPYASSLCGACYEVCPVKINIPEVLVYLRSRVVDKNRNNLSSVFSQERIGMKMMARIFLNHERFEKAQRMARIFEKPFIGQDGWIHKLPGLAGQWTAARDLAPIPAQSFREWWRGRKASQ